MAVSGSQHDDDEIEELLSADQNDINSGWYIVDTPKGMRISRRGYEAIQPPSDDVALYENDMKRTKHEDAALYVREGEDNDKFYKHPQGKWSKRAYQALHSTVYHVFNLCVCTLLLFLALMEHPLVAPIVAHAPLEIFLLSFLWLDMVLRFLWFRPKNFFIHKRTFLILVVLVVMTVEAIVVLARQQNHIRITRALRPIFLVDTYLMHGVRRVLRQIFLCIRPILDVILLLILSLVVFSLLGYLIFAELDITYFASFKITLVSFFIASTTANHPDIWLEAYIRQPASALFFILYIIVMVYFISNVLLAVVYSSFNEANKEKFRKLFIHKRDALRLAYNVLATSPPNGIKFHDFLLFMHEYRPRIPEWQVMCIFKTLYMYDEGDTSPSNDEGEVKSLTLKQFYGFYEVINLERKRVSSDGEELMWFQQRKQVSSEGEELMWFQRLAKVVYDMVENNKWFFNYMINVVVVANLISLVIYTYFIDETDVSDRFFILNNVVAVSLGFVCIYVLEICLRVFGVGPYKYFRKPRNIVDTLVISTSLVLLILEAVSPAYSGLAVFRPVKFIRLLYLKRRYRDISKTLYSLSRRLISVGLILLVVYYAFAIIGMEFFNEAVSEGCCNESMYGVGEYYSGTNSTFTAKVYYVLNFDSILSSYVTLFVLMVINNWFIIMEGFASTSPNGWLVRIYFMSFYLFTLVVLQVVLTFIVNAFMFKIQNKEKFRKQCLKHPYKPCNCHNKNEDKKVAHIKLIEADMENLRYEVACSDQTEGGISLDKWIRHRRRVNLDSVEVIYSLACIGHKDLYLLMHRNELAQWIKEHEEEGEKAEAEPEAEKTSKWWKLKTTFKYLFMCLLNIVKSCLLYIVE